jgi:uncharacterized protein (TIGR02722 family)
MHAMPKLSWLGLSVLFLVGCATPPNPSSRRPTDEEGLTSSDVDMHDYNLVMEKIATSLLQADLRTSDGRKPVITFGPIYNHTNYNIETRMLQEDIRIPVLRSGKAHFSTATDHLKPGGESGELYRQLEFQNQSGQVSAATAKQFGQLIGADYILFGNIYNIGRQNRQVVESNYNFVLTLTSVETGLAVWSDKKQIRKQIRR